MQRNLLLIRHERCNSCTNEHLISLASFFEIPVIKQMKKQSIKNEISSVSSKKGLLLSEANVEGAGSDESEAVLMHKYSPPQSPLGLSFSAPRYRS